MSNEDCISHKLKLTANVQVNVMPFIMFVFDPNGTVVDPGFYRRSSSVISNIYYLANFSHTLRENEINWAKKGVRTHVPPKSANTPFKKYLHQNSITASLLRLLASNEDVSKFHLLTFRLSEYLSLLWSQAKNIERGRNSSCYIVLCAKSVGNFTTVTDRQLFGFGNLWFYTFIKDLCLEKCYSIYLVKIYSNLPSQNVKNHSNIISQLNRWKLCAGYPQTMHDPSYCWQHKSCYSNILLICLSWPQVEL